jgi:NAD(P)-dependent dehydrogenase (short-subunit alcohol dehydrogenase family)
MILKKYDLKNRHALITGAGGLLGLQHSIALLEVGASIVITDINFKKLRKNYQILIKKFINKKIIMKVMDVTNEKSILNCRNYLKKSKINIDILLNNASFDPKVNNLKKNHLATFSLKQWQKEFEVGLTGAFLCSKIFGQEMAKRKKGVILNISSDLSVISPDQRIYNKKEKKINIKPITYSVIKTGLIGMTRYLATYWANENVRCNALSPGGIKNNQDINFVRKIRKLIPLNRMAEKNEYHSAIQFLCSDASSYMNGHNMVIDGGRSVW